MSISTLHIFKVGTHTANSGLSLTFSAGDLAATAAAYDPAKHEAPLVVGHPATDDPAYGWVDALALLANGLEATPRQVDPAFAALVNDEHFNRISSSFFLPDAPNNPVPGVYYLRHVGFLGAAAPAVKGLRKPSFSLSDEAGTVTVDFSIPDVGATGRSPVPHEVSFVSETNPPSAPTAASPSGNTVDYAAQARALETENARLQAELTAERARQARSEVAAFAETLIGQGRLLPRDKAGLIEFVSGIQADQAVQFADGGTVVKTTARAWLDDFLERLPVQVDFSERTAGAAAHDPAAQFSAPPGYAVDESQLAKHQQALALAKARGIPYAQALTEIG